VKFIDPAAFARLSQLHLRVQCVVEGLLSGLHQSPRHGHSLEFAQHREYSHGDELRRIDWKVFARSDRFFVKQFQDETNLRAYLLLDASASMKFGGSGRPDKLAYASQLTAALAYLLLRQEDAVSGLRLAANRGSRLPSPATGRRGFPGNIRLVTSLFSPAAASTIASCAHL